MDELLETQYQRYVDEGDDVALERLVTRCRPVLMRLARRLGHYPEDSEDLVQETLIAALERADRYDRSRPLLPWLKGILTHRAATLARSARRRAARVQSRRPEPASEEGGVSLGSELEDPSGIAVADELFELLRRSLAEMPGKYGRPLELHLLSGMDPVDIATQLDETRSTVRVRLHRGLKLLRGQLPAGLAGSLLLAVLNRKAAAAGLAAGIGWSALRWTAAAVVGVAVTTVVTITLTNGGDGDDGAEGRSKTETAVRDSAAPAATTDEERSSVVEPEVARQEPEPVVVEVVDELGRGIPHVGVVLTPAGGVDPILSRQRAVTDASGLCSLRWPGARAVVVTLDRGAEEDHVLSAPVDAPLRVTVTGGMEVRGRVVDSRGHGVAGASVWAGDITVGPWRGTDVISTDSAGRFVLDQFRAGGFVAARAPEYGRSDVFRVFEEWSGEIILALNEPGGQVRGVVLDQEGRAVAGALVFVGESKDAPSFRLMGSTSAWRPPPYESRCSEDGSFSTLGLEEGFHPLVVLAPGFAPHGSSVVVRVGETTATEVRLVTGARVSGVIRDAEGEPIRAASVALRGIDFAADADIHAVDGAFCFECVPRGVALFGATARGYIRAERTVEVLAGDTVRVIDLVLERPAALRGRMIDTQGNPAKGYQVRAIFTARNSMAPSESESSTDGFGEFSLDLPASVRPGLSVRRHDEPIWHDVSKQVTWTESGAQILLPAHFEPSAWLSGRILDSRSLPFDGARLHLRLGRDPFGDVGRTGAAGDFRLGPLCPGTYTLFAETPTPDMPSAEIGTWVLSAGEERRIEATLEETGRLEYHLFREDGQPIHDLVVTVNLWSFPARAAAFALPRGYQELLPEKHYRLTAMGANVGWLMSHPFEIRPGETTEVRVALEPAVHRRLVLSGFPAEALAESDTARFRVIRLADGATVWSGTVPIDLPSPQPLLVTLPVGKFELWFTIASGRRFHGWFEVQSLEPRYSAIPVEVRGL